MSASGNLLDDLDLSFCDKIAVGKSAESISICKETPCRWYSKLSIVRPAGNQKLREPVKIVIEKKNPH